ncbi:44779_t:CDS:2, partial [Gigaspora margarita]
MPIEKANQKNDETTKKVPAMKERRKKQKRREKNVNKPDLCTQCKHLEQSQIGLQRQTS